jgi:hypothetical protein
MREEVSPLLVRVQPVSATLATATAATVTVTDLRNIDPPE